MGSQSSGTRGVTRFFHWVFLRTVSRNPRQMLRSWYVAFFQLPALPEWHFSRNNFRDGVRALLGSSQPGTFAAEDLDRYREAWSHPGTVTAMINWYRALSAPAGGKRPAGACACEHTLGQAR